MIGNLDFRVQICSSRNAISIVFNFFRIAVYPIACNMKFRHVDESDTAKNPCSCVPAGIGLHTGIYNNSYPVGFSEIDIRCDIYGKRDVPVVLQTGFSSIYVDCGVHHNSVKMQINFLVCPCFGNFNIFSIRGDSCCVISAGACRRGCPGHISLDHIVVRKIYFPSAFCFRGILKPGIKAILKFPPLINILTSHLSYLRYDCPAGSLQTESRMTMLILLIYMIVN